MRAQGIPQVGIQQSNVGNVHRLHICILGSLGIGFRVSRDCWVLKLSHLQSITCATQKDGTLHEAPPARMSTTFIPEEQDPLSIQVISAKSAAPNFASEIAISDAQMCRRCGFNTRTNRIIYCFSSMCSIRASLAHSSILMFWGGWEGRGEGNDASHRLLQKAPGKPH